MRGMGWHTNRSEGARANRAPSARGTLGMLRAAAVAAACLAAALPCASLDPARRITQYSLRQWTTEEGLPQNSVQAIAQTPDGYLWVGTQDGLARFDGLHFALFDGATTPALTSTNITGLAVDGEGTLWVGTETGGLLRLRGGALEPVALPGPKTSPSVRTLHRDSRGGIWVGMRQGKVFHFPVGGAPEVLSMPGAAAERGVAYGFCEDHEGRVLLATYQHGLFRIEGGQILPFEAEGAPQNLYGLLRDAKGRLWAATEGEGIVRFDGAAWKAFGRAEGVAEANVYALLEDRRGSLWAGSYGGGLLRLGPSERFAAWDKAVGFPAEVVLCLFEDREDNLWIGTLSGGLIQLRDGSFLPHGMPEGLGEEMVSCVLEDRAGALWAGTYGGGLWRLADGAWRVFGREEGLPDQTVYSLAESREGGLWVGTGAGVCRLGHGAPFTLNRGDGLPSDMIYTLLEARDGAAWFGTGGGLARYRKGKLTVWSKGTGLSASTVASLFEDSAGRIWVGTTRGINLCAGEQVTPQGPRAGELGMQVFSIAEDAAGTHYFATYGGGLAVLRGETWSLLTTREGLPSDYLYTAVPDARGNLWLSSSRGIYRIAASDLAAAGNSAAPLKFRSLGRDEGMRSAECNGGTQPSAWRAHDGHIWFPTVRGLAGLIPEGPGAEAPSPVPLVEALRYDGGAVAAAGEADLPPGRGDLEIDYTAPAFSAPAKVRFRYRLPPFQEEWVEAGTRRTAYFTRVPPGRYRFEVQAAAGESPWSASPPGRPLRIRPHLYQTWYFFVVSGLSLIALVLLSFYLRVRHLKARQRELEALVEVRTAHLEEALATVRRQGEELKRFNTQLEEQVREQLGTILRSKRLAKYFPRKLVDAILGQQEDVHLQSERRLITIFFTDLAGFTVLTDRTEPERLTALINRYLSEMAALIEAHGGTLARFMGDGILGFFGTPDEMDPDAQAERAVRMGLAMQRRMEELRQAWAREGGAEGLALRVGVHQDFVTVGNYGSPDHMEYTAIGRGINLAKRLETACPPGAVLVSPAVFARTQGLFAYGPPEEQTFKGFAHPLPVYTVWP